MRRCGKRAQGPWEDRQRFNGARRRTFQVHRRRQTPGISLTNGLPKDLCRSMWRSRPAIRSALRDCCRRPTGKLELSTARMTRARTGRRSPTIRGRRCASAAAICRFRRSIQRILTWFTCASTVTMRSTDGGKTWIGFRGAPGGDDYQNLWINPNNPQHYSAGQRSGRDRHRERRRDLEFLVQPADRAALPRRSPTITFPYRVCGGQQESGSVCISSRGNDGEITFREWHPVGVIEYGYVAPDPLDPDIVYGGGRTEVSKFHWSTGQVQNVTPIPAARPEIPRGSHRADDVFARRSAHSLLRGQRAVQDDRWRKFLADHQP